MDIPNKKNTKIYLSTEKMSKKIENQRKNLSYPHFSYVEKQWITNVEALVVKQVEHFQHRKKISTREKK